MCEIEYFKGIKKEELLKLGIVIDDDAKIEDGVILSRGVSVLGKSFLVSGCEIKNNSVIENSIIEKNVIVQASFITDSKVGEGSTVGPFANIKKGTEIKNNCRIGNYVEVKNSLIGEGSKIAHLTYVGDAEIGNNCNIGCGVVFCNYNGEIKQKVKLGNDVFVGSNVNLIAPLKIEDGVYIAAGSTISKDVPKDNFSIARAYQTNKTNFKNPYKNKKN